MSEIYGNIHFRDRVSMGSLDLPANSVVNASVVAGAGLAASKLQHQHAIRYSQAVVADTVIDETMVVHICQGAGSVEAVEVVSAVAPLADTDFFTVDVQRVRGGAALSVLTAVITYNNTNAPANWTIITGTIDGAVDDLLDGDMLQVIVDATDNGSTNASGLCVTITIREAA
jgi:hypothetical protein